VEFVKLYCDICAGQRRYEQPPCQDDHRADCPEWACVSCGDALLIAPFTVRLARRTAGSRRDRLVRRAA
jgi:hypothetical protein